jgi:hypothetical protein
MRENRAAAGGCEDFRNMAEGGGPFGGAGGETHIHIHTIDAAGVQQFLPLQSSNVYVYKFSQSRCRFISKSIGKK